MTNAVTENPVETVQHNHNPDATAIQVAKARLEMKMKAAASHNKPVQIYSEVISKVGSNDVKARIPNEEVCKKAIRREKIRNYPKVPTSLAEFVIEGRWSTTGAEVKERFLLYDNNREGMRIVIFSSDAAIEKLGTATEWVMDVTFSMAPPLFEQVCIIRIPLSTSHISVVSTLLERKNKETYEEMLSVLLRECEHRGIFPEPEYIMVDFEQAVHQAITTTFDGEVSPRGCFYHLTQATWRKLQSIGLQQYYRENEEFQKFVGMMDGLAFLPVADVKDGLAYLSTIVPDDGLELLEYFDATYVNGSYRRVRSRQGVTRLKRVAPLFPPAMWNVHNATLNDGARTNNACEAWNHKYFHMIGHHHPSVWRTIESFQRENAAVSVLLQQDAVGQRPAKRIRRKYDQLQLRLKNLCLDYINNRKNIREFLEGLGYNMRILK
ncbi:uncharacterized protein LOC143025681 [Oratosquilla oratoria]|uniref:uncharacterized protein LOC143025681 n=1 Tax=Oratosquilla oratoria TaxID=337810 RepID=UPI003F75B585